jgi:hypothetical protein
VKSEDGTCLSSGTGAGGSRLDITAPARHNENMPKRSSKKPEETPAADAVNQEPQPVADAAPEVQQDDGGKNPAAVALGRLGGLKGGKARAAKLSKKRRSEIAKNAAAARWKKQVD